MLDSYYYYVSLNVCSNMVIDVYIAIYVRSYVYIVDRVLHPFCVYVVIILGGITAIISTRPSLLTRAISKCDQGTVP